MKDQVDAFVEEQKLLASGMRREMLEGDLSGTKKLLESVLLPVLKSLEGLELEYEIISANGVKIYADVFMTPYQIVFECDGFVSHAENITRDRFSFERRRARAFARHGYAYMPFSRDELDKKADACRRDVYELLGRCGRLSGLGMHELPLHEREILRYGMMRERFSLAEARACLLLSEGPTRKLLKTLCSKALIKPFGEGRARVHFYSLTERGRDYFYSE